MKLRNLVRESETNYVQQCEIMNIEQNSHGKVEHNAKQSETAQTTVKQYEIMQHMVKNMTQCETMQKIGEMKLNG